MKIIAIGRNYAEHAKELNNPVPTVPVIFMKPDTALLRENKPFYHPDFSEDIHHEIEIVPHASHPIAEQLGLARGVIRPIAEIEVHHWRFGGRS